jgi:hypothetical protein
MRATGRSSGRGQGRGGGRRRLLKPDVRITWEERQRLYQRVEEHLAKGNMDLPSLTEEEVREVAAMAKSRGDERIAQLCRDWW